MEAPLTDADAIRARGWRQGSIIRPAALPPESIADRSLPENTLLYVLTHDCDLVQADFEKEPYVELLVMAPINQPDGNFAFGRHPRLLDIQLAGGAFRLCCHDRLRLSRPLLAGIDPLREMAADPYLRDLIAEWMAKRYLRPAFPDAFNRRIAEQGRPIQRFCKKWGHLFSQFYIHCAPEGEELPDGATYDLTVWMVLQTEAAGSAAATGARALAEQFANILKACPGIQLDDCRSVTEDDVTLAHLHIFSPWDFDYLTHREALHPS